MCRFGESKIVGKLSLKLKVKLSLGWRIVDDCYLRF